MADTNRLWLVDIAGRALLLAKATPSRWVVTVRTAELQGFLDRAGDQAATDATLDTDLRLDTQPPNTRGPEQQSLATEEPQSGPEPAD